MGLDLSTHKSKKKYPNPRIAIDAMLACAALLLHVVARPSMALCLAIAVGSSYLMAHCEVEPTINPNLVSSRHCFGFKNSAIDLEID